MSLVPTYVKMADSKWYQNPVIYGEDWYICFDDDDPPEMVIREGRQYTKNERYNKFVNMLKVIGIAAHVKQHMTCGSRLYPPESKNFYPSICAFIEIVAVIDLTNLLVKYDKVSNKQPNQQGVYYEWSS